MSVRIERGGGRRRLTLDRPEHYNALTGEMVDTLVEQLREVGSVPVDHPDADRVVVLTGSGAAFCAGADVGGQDAHQRYGAASVDAAATMVRAVLELDRPVVCGLNGVAAGVGVSLLLACDLVLAAESASLTLGFSRLGLMPDGGATLLLAAAVGRARAMRLALTSSRLSAREACAAGLVGEVRSDAEYPDALDALVGELAAGAPLALAATKKAVNAATLGGLADAFARERSGQAVLLRPRTRRRGCTPSPPIAAPSSAATDPLARNAGSAGVRSETNLKKSSHHPHTPKEGWAGSTGGRERQALGAESSRPRQGRK